MTHFPTHRLLIDGHWHKGIGTTPNINPSDTRDVIGLHEVADAALTDAAIDAAHRAAAGWAASTPQQRCDVLDRVGTLLLERRGALGELLAREEGKTLPEAVGEVTRAGQIFKYHAHLALHADGETVASTRPGIRVEVSREPLGVVGVITPWNFPMAIPAWKIAPALACGNTVVFKPADLVPGSAAALAAIIQECGLPAGAFNMVHGPGAVVGQRIVDDPRVAAVSFTGSAHTGQQIAAACARRMARHQLEMGGKNPLVVLDDADLDVAVECAIQGAFHATGQRCTASSRLIVTRGIYTRLRDALTERTRALRVGHALHGTTQIGPVVDARQLEQDLRYIDIGRAEGARLACGGGLIQRDTPGHYLAPALFVDADNAMRISQEEIFGPVAALIPARDAEEALFLANETPFGLSAGVCTTSLRWATHFQRQLRAGMVMVNTPTAGVDYHVPFGGTRSSSFGSREQGTFAREFFTQVKTSYVCP